jgi:hypothetical protein
VIDDAVDNSIVCDEGNDTHFALALRTGQRINLIHFSDHLRPAAARDFRALLLDNQEFVAFLCFLASLPPVGVSVEAEITDGDLALVRNMGSDPGDELQINIFNFAINLTSFPFMLYPL